MLNWPANKKSDVVIVSNRLPVRRVQRGGQNRWETSPGGLVSALSPVLSKSNSTWIGWAGTSGAAPKPFQIENTWNLPVSLSREEVRDYYEGFCNRTIWPLYHDGIQNPEFHREWWRPYVTVNQRFAEAAAQVTEKNGVVWVHDYQLQLVPAILRSTRPDLKIGFFLHIPFPPQELFAQLPWRQAILRGMLGADVVGFQTRWGARNFIELCQRFTSAERERDTLHFEGREIRATDFPISIDMKQIEKLATSEEVRARSRRLRARLAPHQKIILGVDRLDYTKGIDLRLRGFQELLKSGRVSLERCVMVQVAVPSREYVPEYQALRERIERIVGEINGEFGELGRMPVHYLHRSYPVDEVVALYLAADVMLVTPLRDGMNLVAKEYVASRTDESGALILSEFAGAAHELREALIVNPHDIEAVKFTIDTALNMPVDQQKTRMRALRRTIRRHDVFDWAELFFQALGYEHAGTKTATPGPRAGAADRL